MVRLVALLRPIPLALATVIAVGLIALAAMYGWTANPGSDGTETTSSVRAL